MPEEIEIDHVAVSVQATTKYPDFTTKEFYGFLYVTTSKSLKHVFYASQNSSSHTAPHFPDKGKEFALMVARMLFKDLDCYSDYFDVAKLHLPNSPIDMPLTQEVKEAAMEKLKISLGYDDLKIPRKCKQRAWSHFAQSIIFK